MGNAFVIGYGVKAFVNLYQCERYIYVTTFVSSTHKYIIRHRVMYLTPCNTRHGLSDIKPSFDVVSTSCYMHRGKL